VIVSSHALAEVEQIADDVIVIARGRLVRSTSLAELRTEAGVRTCVRTPEVERLRCLLEAARYDCRQIGHEELVVDAAPELVGELAAGHQIALHRLFETGHLEEVFFRLTEVSRP